MEREAYIFWENVARKVGKEYPAEGAPLLTKDKGWAILRDEMEKKHLMRVIRIDKDMEVLDLGCGTGRWSFEFAKRCKKVLAVDFSPTFISIAKEQAFKEGVENVTFLCQPITKFSYLEKQRFDIIHLGSVLQYLDDSSVNLLIDKLNSHLKEKGMIVTRETISLGDRLYGGENYPCIYRVEEEFLEMFKRKGLELIYSHFSLPPLSKFFVKIRLIFGRSIDFLVNLHFKLSCFESIYKFVARLVGKRKVQKFYVFRRRSDSPS